MRVDQFVKVLVNALKAAWGDVQAHREDVPSEPDAALRSLKALLAKNRAGTSAQG